MRILIDCDILLDVALRREPHFEASAALLDWAERHPGRAAAAWHSLSNLHYLCDEGARLFIKDLVSFVEIPPVGTHHMRQALDLPMRDLEDAMLVVIALEFRAQAIATRNLKDYRHSPLRAVSPSELLRLLVE